jgi:hypothetical protein
MLTAAANRLKLFGGKIIFTGGNRRCKRISSGSSRRVQRIFSRGLNTDETRIGSYGFQTIPCGQKSLPTHSESICADNFQFRVGIIRFVRTFFRPCGDNSICAGDWPFRASQLPVRAGKNQSVRPFFDSCGKKADLWAFLKISGGQKETI